MPCCHFSFINLWLGKQSYFGICWSGIIMKVTNLGAARASINLCNCIELLGGKYVCREVVLKFMTITYYLIPLDKPNTLLSFHICIIIQKRTIKPMYLLWKCLFLDNTNMYATFFFFYKSCNCYTMQDQPWLLIIYCQLTIIAKLLPSKQISSMTSEYWVIWISIGCFDIFKSKNTTTYFVHTH